MDIIQLHERAMEQTGQIVDGVASTQHALPTPCTEWNVDALIDHVTTINWMFVGIAEGKPPEGGAGSPDTANEDSVAMYRRSVEVLSQAWRAPGRAEQTYQMPFGEMTGEAALGIHVADVVTHGWDLAKATGQQANFDPAVVEVATQTARVTFDGMRGPGMPFAAAVPVSGDLPAVDRLAAFLGRQP
jgi:uncharacterized protein (TIGR03086 family)